MIFTLDTPSSSSPTMCYSVYICAESKPSYTHEARPVDYSIISEKDSIEMMKQYAQASFKKDWDTNDEEENNYWNSF